MRFTPNNICEPAKPNTTDWKSIKWNKVRRHVTNLQERIYRASKNSDKKKVRDLQRQLMRSNSALLIAINRVTKINRGRFTPGIDGFKVNTDKGRAELYDKMKTMKMKNHRPKPAFRKYIPKKNGKLRSLGIPTIIDRIYQEIIRMALESEWEAKFEPTSYGFRPKRRQHDAVRRIYYNIISGKWCWIYEGDFKSCFDTLSHDFILKQIKGFPQYNLVKRFLEAGYVDDGVFNETTEGTPQGGLLSPLLANIALHGMEKALNISYKENTRMRNGKIIKEFIPKGKYRFCRYADDFLIFAQSYEDVNKINELLQHYLDERGLILAEDKTKITHLSKGFDFIGFNFRRYDDNVSRVKPSKDSMQKLKEKIDYVCKTSYGNNARMLIDRLNPIIRGTAYYWMYAISNNKELSKMDHYIWIKTFKFLTRLHPKKGKRWIKKKYYPVYNENNHHDNWILTDPKSDAHLVRMSWYTPKRYIMVKHDYSPYDKKLKDYFENRTTNFSLFG